MLKIKLRPVGKKHQRSFRIIVQEARQKLKGKFVEDLGFWNPHFDKFKINKERASYWLNQGAQPTDTCYNLLVNAEIIKGPKKPVHKRKKVERAEKGEEKVEKEEKETASQNLDQKTEEKTEEKESSS